MTPSIPRQRLQLPQVTLVAVTSVNVEATIQALQACLVQIDFGACKLLTDRPMDCELPGIQVVPIRRLASSYDYSHFLLSDLADHVATSHCLVCQWDGHVIDAGRWSPEFLDWDYIGASWPQFDDGKDVGNGGFSLRSKLLLEACRASGFEQYHPEDIAICRHNRDWLETQGMRLADRALADRFSAERAGDVGATFGYHGVWHMARVLGVPAFWDLYRNLDDRGTVWHDFDVLLKQVVRGPGGPARALRLIGDRIYNATKARK